MTNKQDKSAIAAEDQVLKEISARHGVSVEVIASLLSAFRHSGGRMAQFNHPELGGMGQWSSGMLMIGEFSNTALKQKVQAICDELSKFVNDNAEHLDNLDKEDINHMSGEDVDEKLSWKSFKPFKPFDNEKWWPQSLGAPTSVGSQNESQYAYFPESNRLAIKENSQVTIFDTGAHKIFGVSQQQGENNSLVFDSQLGRVRVTELTEVEKV
jgi:hypothetical protein